MGLVMRTKHNASIIQSRERNSDVGITEKTKKKGVAFGESPPDKIK